MLDLAFGRDAATPRDAATLLLVRDGSGGALEVFCVQRHVDSGFLGGAIVFPGGKVDEADRDPAWAARTTEPAPASFAPDAPTLRAIAIAACREALEEAAILPLASPPLAHEELVALRAQAKARSLLACAAERGLTIDLAALCPFARWVTPTAEARRFDARFFLAPAPAGQPGAHDERETTASFWATPREILARFDARAARLAPPTHRSLAILAESPTAEIALARAARANLDPICPRLVRHVDGAGETLALVLPGDRDHEVREARAPGPSRFVLRGELWLPEDAPPALT